MSSETQQHLKAKEIQVYCTGKISPSGVRRTMTENKIKGSQCVKVTSKKLGFLFGVFYVKVLSSLLICSCPPSLRSQWKFWSKQISGSLTEQSKTGQECRIFCHSLIYLQRKSELKNRYSATCWERDENQLGILLYVFISRFQIDMLCGEMSICMNTVLEVTYTWKCEGWNSLSKTNSSFIVCVWAVWW